MPSTIGSITTVPVPGDPITSPWAQDVSRLAVHHFATIAALKAAWPAPPDGSMAWVTGEDALVVAKGGSWRWLTKDFGLATGNTGYLTWTGAAVNAATATSALQLVGRTATLRATCALVTPATSGNLAVANLAAAYRSAVQLNEPAMGFTTATWSVRLIIQTNGDLQPFWGGAASAIGTLVWVITWQLPDLVPVP